MVLLSSVTFVLNSIRCRNFEMPFQVRITCVYGLVFVFTMLLLACGCKETNCKKSDMAKYDCVNNRKGEEAGAERKSGTNKSVYTQTVVLRCTEASSVTIKQDAPYFGANMIVTSNVECGKYIEERGRHIKKTRVSGIAATRHRTEVTLSIHIVLRKGRGKLSLPSNPFVFYEQICQRGRKGDAKGACGAELSGNLRSRPSKNQLVNEQSMMNTYRIRFRKEETQEVFVMMPNLKACEGRHMKRQLLATVEVLPIKDGEYRVEHKLYPKSCSGGPGG